MMKMFSPYTVAIAALVALHLAFVEGNFGDASVDATQSLNNKITIDYTLPDAFKPSEIPVKEIHLNPGDEIKIICSGTPLSGGKGLVMHPFDPTNKVLAPLGYDKIADAVNRESYSHMVYRSNDNIVVEENVGNSRVVFIRYPPETIILAENPESFSLNFACEWQPENGSYSIYRWLAVTFKHVYPMAYGCETGQNQLFKNTTPVTLARKGLKNDRMCRIDPKPGMLIGIYCGVGESIHPPNCIPSEILTKHGGGLKPFIMAFGNSLISDRDLRRRVMFFQVPTVGLKSSVHLSCSCVNRMGLRTKTLLMENTLNDHLNIFKRIMKDEIGVRGANYHHMQFLRPGRKYIVDVPKDGLTHLVRDHHIVSKLYPSVETPDSIYFGVVGGEHEAAPLEKYMGTKGFTIVKSRKGPIVIYVITYRKDAIVVMKSRVLNMFYILDLSLVNAPINARNHVTIEFGILPTDPFTYGCGVDSRELFHTDATKIEDIDFEDGKSYTSCTVNATVVSPIGFYCPKGYTLDPPDCFTHMKLASNWKQVSLSDYAPYARVIPGNNIRVLDTNVSKGKADLVKYSDESLVCRCLDQDGVDRAAIYVNFNKMTKTEFENFYGKMESNLLWDA
ncbi:hypothetical protein X943_003792 [Babesia divergens]|uniref:6-Cys domain-containing protein n=1 Tax=Babesia divergens TaxID=32595 RepID=A0AAD9LLB6_BABDI|nr:hypothetical protein X943_003792 [Babesia divergens]